MALAQQGKTIDEKLLDNYGNRGNIVILKRTMILFSYERATYTNN